MELELESFKRGQRPVFAICTVKYKGVLKQSFRIDQTSILDPSFGVVSDYVAVILNLRFKKYKEQKNE